MQDILHQIIATKRAELPAIRSAVSVPGGFAAGASPLPAPHPASLPAPHPASLPAPHPSLNPAPHPASLPAPHPSLNPAPLPSLRAALLASPTGIIAEFKRRSPSKGWINESARPDIIPLAYQRAGAAALSILTDEHYFGGHDDFIRQARQSGVTLPILYKNFVIDEAQLYAALACGASAVLLIAACLSKSDCKRLLDKAHALGLEVLLEMHSEEELDYATLGPDLCGINNRNLGSFHTDVANSFRLADQLRASATVPAPSAADLPPVLVSESGISDPATVRALRAAGFRGFLIGETFMREPDPGRALSDFISEIDCK